MPERQPEQPSRSPDTRAAPPRPGSGVDPLAVATFAGVMAVLVVSFASWRDVSRLDRRVRELEGRAGQGGGEAPSRAVHRGPDPDRVYAIRTAGAPSRGRASAPVTVAAFSDFQ
jgi:hypothetical protein